MNARASITLIAALAISTPTFATVIAPVIAPVVAQDVTPLAEHLVEQAAPEPEFTTADEILDALESVRIDKLTASIAYTKIEEFLGERKVRFGTMQFVTIPREGLPDQKKFAVRFDALFIGNIKDDEPKIYIFDGQWFVEKMPNERLIIKRQIARPGQEVDPLRIGQGPFPIPIGQKKADILSRFNAELLPSDDGLTIDPDDEDADDPEAVTAAKALVTFAQGSYQIRLTPRPEFKDTLDLAEARLWYKLDEGGSLVPLLARTVNIDGDISIVQLINVKVGDAAVIDDDLFDASTPENWDAQEIRFGG